jgi:hypothetical protein
MSRLFLPQPGHGEECLVKEQDLKAHQQKAEISEEIKTADGTPTGGC